MVSQCDMPESPVARSTSDSSSAPSRLPRKSLQKNSSNATAPAVVVRRDELPRASSIREGEVEQLETERATRTGLSWPITACYMIAYNISAGVMTLPRVFANMGLVAGILIVEGVGCMGGYTAYTQWRAIMRYGHVNTYPDVLALLFGMPGRWLGHINMNLIYLFIAAIHILLSVQEWNAITNHATCSVVFSTVSTFLGFCVTMFRSLREGSALAVGAVISIMGAVLVTMIGVAIHGPELPIHHLFIPADRASLMKISAGISSIIFTFTGHIAYPQFITGMKDPRDFPKALCLNQTMMMAVYTIVAAVLYWCGGEAILAPALNSAPDTWSRIAWAIAFFTILIAATIPMNLLTQNVDSGIQSLREKRATQRALRFISKSGLVPWKRWIPLAAAVWILAWVVAEGIPVFGGLVAFVGAALGCWITLGFGAILWFRIEADEPHSSLELRDNCTRAERRLCSLEDGGIRCAMHQDVPKADPAVGVVFRQFGREALVNCRRRPLAAALNACIVVLCAIVWGLGMYGSIMQIMIGTDRRRPFSCSARD